MKKIQYNLLAFLLIANTTIAYAQKYDKKYNEEFNTNDNVIVSIDSRHADVQIETWNKNKVEIEATIEIQGANEKRKQEIIDNWNFKALGNKNEISIASKSKGLVYSEFPVIFDKLETDNFDFEIPDVSIKNLAILDSLHTITPNVLEIPEPFIDMPEDAYYFSFDSMPFDYEKYKKDKNYLKEWQKKMKEKMGKMKVEWQQNADISKENAAKLKEELKAMQKEREKMVKERNKQLFEVEKRRAELDKQRAKIKKEIDEKKRQELAERRIEVRKILEERDKIKIKRIIKIKAPKDAKFKMNVKYGSISFPN